MKDLLLVIDMQRAYSENGVWHCPGIKRAVKNIKRLISERGDALDIIFTSFKASESPIGLWKNYNEVNKEVNLDPEANEMLPEFDMELKKYPLYEKSVYSALSIPEVLSSSNMARDRGMSVLVTGVVAECCVLSSIMALIDNGNHVIYLKDAAAGTDEKSEEAVEGVLQGLSYLHTEIIETEEYIESQNRRKLK